ncbi:MAG TPA: DUF3019 domain-containing protein [Cellvibrio sp.]|nr:DUF3019 domain-containing protein [Cellvibrio sp.]
MSRLTQGIKIIALWLVCLPLHADELPVSVKAASVLLSPARCVALHQGQMCYQRVQVSWSSSVNDDYCIYQEDREEPLRCWQQQTQGVMEFEFASDGSQQMQLKNAQQQVVAESALEVAWVYKANTRRKTHWRLF